MKQLLQPVAGGQVTCHGFTLSFRPEDMGVISTLLLYRDYEPETTQVVRELLCPGMTFVDLGAHIGYFTLLAAQAVGLHGRVIAFEPIPTTREILARNVIQNGCNDFVTIVPRAVSDISKYVSFCLDNENSVSAKISAAGSEVKDVQAIEAVSLDEFFAAEGWPSVHLIKMDIEGSEMAAIAGMKELSSRNPNLKLIFEFHEHNLHRMTIEPEALFQALRPCGFSRFRILRRHYGSLEMPRDIPKLMSIGKHLNLNILAEKA
jgi:FkbM family methyltransferase